MTPKTEPETGTTTYTYDAAYRLATKTDAKNQRAVYSYDGHGRIAMVQRYPVAGGAEDVRQRTTYVYDTAENGIGRLATVRKQVQGRGQTSPSGNVVEIGIGIRSG